MKRAIVLAALVIVAACSTTPQPAPSQPSASSSEGPWQFVQLPRSEESFLAAVSATDHDALVVGVAGENAKAWSSRDDGPWTPESMPALGYPNRAIVFGDRVLVAGGNQTNRCAHPSELAFWVRDAEGRWTGAPFQKTFCAGGVAHVAGRADIVAVLGSGTGDVPYGYFSMDGLQWADSGLSGNILPQALTTSGDDFVALGTFVDGRWWFGRSNGRAPWAVELARGLPAQLPLFGFAAGGDGVIVWMGDQIREQHAYTSARGDAWREVDQHGLEQAVIGDVRKIGATYLARGIDGVTEFLLASRDATTWHRVDGPQALGGAVSVGDFALSDRKLYLLAASAPDGPPQLWVADVAVLEP